MKRAIEMETCTKIYFLFVSRKFFSAFLASVWSKNKGGGQTEGIRTSSVIWMYVMITVNNNNNNNNNNNDTFLRTGKLIYYMTFKLMIIRKI